jgi:predicted nucleotidyltransferase
MQAARLIPEMVRRMVERTSPSQVVLYGSYARECADPDSDVDLLVIFDRIEDRREIVTQLYASLADIHVPKDIIVATSDEYSRFRRVVNTTFFNISQDGKVVYDRSA